MLEMRSLDNALHAYLHARLVRQIFGVSVHVLNVCQCILLCCCDIQRV